MSTFVTLLGASAEVIYQLVLTARLWRRQGAPKMYVSAAMRNNTIIVTFGQMKELSETSCKACFVHFSSRTLMSSFPHQYHSE
jgi:hypothetical protein